MKSIKVEYIAPDDLDLDFNCLKNTLELSSRLVYDSNKGSYVTRYLKCEKVNNTEDDNLKIVVSWIHEDNNL